MLLLAICGFGQTWQDIGAQYNLPEDLSKPEDKRIPNDLGSAFIFVQKFKGEDFISYSHSKAVKMNEKLEKFFQLYYPYKYKIVDGNFDVSNVDGRYLWLKHQGIAKVVTSQYGSDTSQYTFAYYFEDSQNKKEYENFIYYAAIQFKSLKVLLDNIRVDLAKIRMRNVIKLEPINLIRGGFKHLNIEYERGVNKYISLYINPDMLSYNKPDRNNPDFTQRHSLFALRTGIKIYAFNPRLASCNGVYLGLGYVYARIANSDLDDPTIMLPIVSTGGTITLGTQFRVSKPIIADFNLKYNYLPFYKLKYSTDVYVANRTPVEYTGLSYGYSWWGTFRIGYRF